MWNRRVRRNMRGRVYGLEGKRPHGKPNHKWESSVKMDLKELGRESVK